MPAGPQLVVNKVHRLVNGFADDGTYAVVWPLADGSGVELELVWKQEDTDEETSCNGTLQAVVSGHAQKLGNFSTDCATGSHVNALLVGDGKVLVQASESGSGSYGGTQWDYLLSWNVGAKSVVLENSAETMLDDEEPPAWAKAWDRSSTQWPK